MALGEQFTSREVSEGAEGLTGTRVFVTEWNDRYSHVGTSAVPRHNDRWSPEDDSRIPTSDIQPLWVHEIVRRPYASSSASGSKEAATHARITVTYRGWPLNLTKALDWIVEARHSTNAVDVGPRLVFSTSGTAVPQRGTTLVPVIEFIITGEQQLDAVLHNAYYDVWRDVPGARMLGTVCAEMFRFDTSHVKYRAAPSPNLTVKDAARGHLLFASQSLSAPFNRRDENGQEAMYRKFQRSVYWRGVTESDGIGGVEIVGGHNLLWNANGAVTGWDITEPLLYPEMPWKNPNPGMGDWHYPVPSEILTTIPG